MEENKKQEKQSFLKNLLEKGKQIATTTKDPKINKEIKKRANY